MSDLAEYLSLTKDPLKKQLLKEQYKEASTFGSIHCCCDQLRALTMAYRCLYCGVWFCRNCAEVHFGLTLQEWIKKKRVEKRQDLRNKCTLAIDLVANKCKHFTRDEKPSIPDGLRVEDHR